MKTKILKGIVMMSAVVLSACTSTKYAAEQKKDYNDDVYYSKAKATDQVEYASNDRSYRNDGYYDDYAGRLSRFGGYSPFAYDSYFYSPYSYYGGLGLGLGLGYGLGGFYSPYSIYSPYSFYGGGYYGVGGYGYGGLYSAYGVTSNGNYGARPSRGNGNPGVTYRNTFNTTSRSSLSRSSYYPGNNNPSIRSNTSDYGRAARQYAPQSQRSMPTYNAPAPSSYSGGGGFGGGGGGRVSSARPGRG